MGPKKEDDPGPIGFQSALACILSLIYSGTITLCTANAGPQCRDTPH
jgi:hypothetical protein